MEKHWTKVKLSRCTLPHKLVSGLQTWTFAECLFYQDGNTVNQIWVQSNNSTSPGPTINAQNLYWMDVCFFVISNCGGEKVTKFPHVMIQKTLYEHNKLHLTPVGAGTADS